MPDHHDNDPMAKYNAFIQRSRKNLHIVLCFSPIGNTFRTRLRMFPSLVNCCYIDWFNEWPEEGLRSVAERMLQVSVHMQRWLYSLCNFQYRSILWQYMLV
jgi:dynein heavy chain, axonemal